MVDPVGLLAIDQFASYDVNFSQTRDLRIDVFISTRVDVACGNRWSHEQNVNLTSIIPQAIMIKCPLKV